MLLKLLDIPKFMCFFQNLCVAKLCACQNLRFAKITVFPKYLPFQNFCFARIFVLPKFEFCLFGQVYPSLVKFSITCHMSHVMWNMSYVKSNLNIFISIFYLFLKIKELVVWSVYYQRGPFIPFRKWDQNTYCPYESRPSSLWLAQWLELPETERARHIGSCLRVAVPLTSDMGKKTVSVKAH